MFFYIRLVLWIGLSIFISCNLYAAVSLSNLTDNDVQKKCGAIPPYYGHRFTQIEIEALLAQWIPLHQSWVDEHQLLKKSREELDTIIHFPFVKDRRRINLCGADLSGLDLSKYDLSIANFAYANLKSTSFRYTNLIKTNFYHANLSKADFFIANLSGASLVNANLVGADIFRSLLSDTDFYNANLSESRFFPSPSALPDPLGLVPALIKREQLFKNVKYYDAELDTFSPILTLLRKEYRTRGIRDAERAITYLIQVKLEESGWRKGGLQRLTSTLRWLFFNVTTQYGAGPQNALSIFLTFIVLFTIFYWIALRVDSKHNQFEIVWEAKPQTNNIRRGIMRGERNLIYQPLCFHRDEKTFIELLWLELRILQIAFYFSLMTSLQINWSGNNVSDWIRKLQTREFTLQIKRGWVRSVSGFQSAMNLYLLTIWILAQFGRPFD
ncbi:pentapeptide repeat-containing protein [Candidatus Albibeggiatoa sp. nov. BB20]|uniref:pentapeptide repeat-containing protein n=1 Tax=Candidatus Albibeggiatoa sp. nov. BB20 TaxID=3162723 RepID=UPI003365A62C